MELAPEPKWLRLARNVNLYGIESVFGRTVLYEYEMDAMRIARYIWQIFHARRQSKEWAAWEKANPSAAEALAWAAAEFQKGE